MTDSRITRQRRIFVEMIGQLGRTTFAELKKMLVGKGEGKMDITTLYRIIETFEKQGLIHAIEVGGERIIVPVKAERVSDNDALTITLCENCGAIYDEYSPLPHNYSQSITHARIKSCSACMI